MNDNLALFLAYSDDFSPYGWTHSGFNHFCFEDIHGCFSDGFLPDNFRREFSLVGSHVVIRRQELSSLEVFQPCSKQAKHGSTCLVLPSKLFVMDLTVHVDISSNPGPESNQEITSRSVGLYHHSFRSPQLITYSRSELLSVRRFSPARLPFHLVSVLKDFSLLRTRGCRAGVWAKSRTRQRSIRTVVSNRNDRFSKFASLLNRDSLVKVQISQVANTQDTSHANNFCLLNSRSIRNKSSVLKDFVVDKDIDLLALTETWLRPGNIDCVEIGDLCPTGYDFIHIPRESRGGCVGLLFKESMDIKCKNSEWNTSFQSFEFLDVRFKSSKMIRMIIIYRPPSSVPLSTFYHEFSLLLEELATASGELLIVGDFNLHVDSSRDVNALHFCDLIASFDLKQWVTTPTRTSGHILDLIITRNQCNL